MKKISFSLLFTILFSASSISEPQFYNYTTGSYNIFPFALSAGKFVNWLFLPGAFNQPAPCPSGKQITKIYIMIHTGGTRALTNFQILMAQTTLTNLTTGQFYPGPWDTVFVKDTSLSAPVGAHTWMGINLHTPYPYDPSKSLVVGIGQCGNSGSGMYILQTSLSGIKRTWSVGGCPFVPYSAAGDEYNVDFGIDVEPVIGVGTIISNIPNAYLLNQNYPNPFNPSTKISFSLPKTGDVKLVVYDIFGKLVQILFDAAAPAGKYKVEFDGTYLSSGVYVYKLETPEYTAWRKMVLLK